MTAQPTAGRSRLVPAVAALSALVLIAALVVAGLMYSRISSDRAADRARSEAVTAAEQFALRMDNIQLGDFAQYKSDLEPLLTTKEKTVFEQQFKQFEEVYNQSQQAGGDQSGAKSQAKSEGGQGKIVFSGASDADEDSATVLVAHDSSVPGQDQALHFRWQLGMRRVAGHWLVDDFTPVD